MEIGSLLVTACVAATLPPSSLIMERIAIIMEEWTHREEPACKHRRWLSGPEERTSFEQLACRSMEVPRSSLGDLLASVRPLVWVKDFLFPPLLRVEAR